MKKETKPCISAEESLKRAEEMEVYRKTPVDLVLPMITFLREIFYRKVPASIGHQILMKIIHDAKGVLKLCQADMGDVFSVSPITDLITRFIYAEMKTSFLNTKNLTFNLDHIRVYQDYDYFFVCFVDKLNKYEGLFFILPKDFICDNPSVFKLSAMNNTKRINQHNVNIDMKTAIKRDVVYDLFPKYSLVPTTKYKDFLEVIMSHELHNIRAKSIVQPFKMKVKFDIDGTIINGKTNVESWTKLANHIGTMKAEKFFNSFVISVKPSDLRNVQLQLGNHWLDPNISRWEAERLIKIGNDKTGLNVKLI